MTALRFMRALLATAAGWSAAVACGSCARADVAPQETVQPPPARPAPAGVVDSALPVAEMTRRFRTGLDSVARLDSGAAPSRDILLARFARAVARRDSVALRAMALSRAEFAYLYYPGSIYVRPPYVTGPDVVWRLMAYRSATGLRRLVTRVGGDGLQVVEHSCEAAPVVEGRNHYYRDCVLRYRRAADAPLETKRLFGSIVERNGRWKFVSYANDF